MPPRRHRRTPSTRCRRPKDAGQIRRFTGNDYSDDLVAGNVAIAQAYSGDVAQLQLDNPDLAVRGRLTRAWCRGRTTWSCPLHDRELDRGRAVDELRLRPGEHGPDHRLRAVHPPVEGSGEELVALDPALADNLLINPPQDVRRLGDRLAGPHRRGGPAVLGPVRRGGPGLILSGPVGDGGSGGRHGGGRLSAQDHAVPAQPARAGVPGHLLRHPPVDPVPDVAVQQRRVGLRPDVGVQLGVRNYSDAFRTYDEQILRSFWYALAATLLALVLAYPLAYVLAFKSGRWKNTLLGLVILPFFITFIIRTLAWKTIFADSSFITSVFDFLGLTTNGRILSTQWAVIGGLTYNFLPFMILPIYVSIEKIDPRLLEAARDLYAGGTRTFRKVLLPLSMPGVIAGSLLTFIPASGDFVNAQYLGGTNQAMVGTVIQSQFLVVKDYPLAAALSGVLMLIILLRS